MIATKYIFFAIFSTSMNLLAQFLTFSLLDYSFIIYIAILNGTVAGLVVKYFLDKYYIFQINISKLSNKNTFIPMFLPVYLQL